MNGPPKTAGPRLATQSRAEKVQLMRWISEQASKPESKLRMRLIPALRITAKWSASRADRPAVDRMIAREA